MVVVKNNVMYSCRVFYIGCEHIESGKRGVECLQEPLKSRYRGDANLCEGEDMTITVMPECIVMQPADGAPTELPISTLSVCAAVRCVHSHGDSANMKFVPVHSVITSLEPPTDHPALFSTVMRKTADGHLECFAFICNETRDALHLVNATQTAHTTMRRGMSPSGVMKFFIDQRTEFDQTIHLKDSSSGKRVDSKKIYMYTEDYDTRDLNRASTRRYVTSYNDQDTSHVSHISRHFDEENVVVNGDESQTYYVKAGDYKQPDPPPATESETIVVGFNAEETRPATPPPAQTYVIDAPVVRPAPPVEIPKPEIVTRKVFVDAPKLPKIAPQKIIVDVPVFKGFPEWDPPPKPIINTREVEIKPPPPPPQPAQRIIVDQPVIREYPTPPPAPPPEVVTNPVEVKLPGYPPIKPQKIVVDKPFIKQFPTPPVAPPPIIEERLVEINCPDYQPIEPQKIVIEKPVFNPPPPPPKIPPPIFQVKEIPIDPPAYPPIPPQTIVVEKPIIKDPGPPPACPPPNIIEKKVFVPGPTWPELKPQTIIVEKIVMRDPGPPPPPPPPIIKEKIVYVDCPPWQPQKPHVIVVEKPVFRRAPAPPAPKPIVMEKPVVVEAPPAPPPPRQRIVVERPIYGTSYQTRTGPTGYVTERAVMTERAVPSGYRSSYVVRAGSPKGLRRYAWSDNGEADGRYNDQDFRIYGQRRDFRQSQFMNEKGFSRRLNNEDIRYSRRAGSYTYDPRRGGGSVSS